MPSPHKTSSLSTERLTGLLPSKTLNQSLFIFEELPSTNTFALELAKHSAPSGTVVLADQQTAGRGRLQRSWFSPPETNIYGSLIFIVDTPFQSLGWIPLMAGTAIADAIQRQTNIHITLKWPNDILVNEHKVGGVLCESFVNRETTKTCVVIGFGINVNLPKSAFLKDLPPMTTSLHLHTKESLDRHLLLQSIIMTLEQAWDTLISEGPTACKLAYSACCSTLGNEVHVQFPDGSHLEGQAQSIGKHGQLQVRPSTSRQPGRSDDLIDIHAGDILHLRKPEHDQSQ